MKYEAVWDANRDMALSAIVMAAAFITAKQT